MSKKQVPSKRSASPVRGATATLKLPSVPAEAALSFLKDTKGALSWTPRDLADTLKIHPRDAQQVIALLQAQGYAQPAQGRGEWITTPAGETVAGAKPPRFTRESVEQALAGLKERIQETNKNAKSSFQVDDAVAFGDFLLKDRPRVQAADVGVRLVRPDDPSELRSANDAKAERAFLRQLRGKSALLSIGAYAEWMRARSHRSLL